jgi:hypothetical protein
MFFRKKTHKRIYRHNTILVYPYQPGALKGKPELNPGFHRSGMETYGAGLLKGATVERHAGSATLPLRRVTSRNGDSSSSGTEWATVEDGRRGGEGEEEAW